MKLYNSLRKTTFLSVFFYILIMNQICKYIINILYYIILLFAIPLNQIMLTNQSVK